MDVFCCGTEVVSEQFVIIRSLMDDQSYFYAVTCGSLSIHQLSEKFYAFEEQGIVFNLRDVVFIANIDHISSLNLPPNLHTGNLRRHQNQQVTQVVFHISAHLDRLHDISSLSIDLQSLHLLLAYSVLQCQIIKPHDAVIQRFLQL